MDWSCASWVNCCAFSPTGNTIAFGGQDSSVHFVSFNGGPDPLEQIIRLNGLPLCDMNFLSDNALIAGGHDCNPMLFAGSPWRFVDYVDKKVEGAAVKASSTGAAAARAMFQAKTSQGQNSKKDSADAWKKHQSPITSLQKLPDPGSSSSTAFSSTALDGRVTHWDLAEISHIDASIVT